MAEHKDRLQALTAAGKAAVANPGNPIGKEGLPGRRHREIVQAIHNLRDSRSQDLSSVESLIKLENQVLHNRLDSIRSTQRWMFATVILLLILAGLIATFMGLLILRLNV